MEVDKYEVLLQVLKTGSINQAAERCGYSVSGVSRMIASIERELGCALLYRTHGGIAPTKECEILLPQIRELVFRGAMIRRQAEALCGSKSGVLRIGIAYSNYYGWMANLANTFGKDHPDVTFQFRDGYSSELLQAMMDHELDICLISKRNRVEQWMQIGEEEMVAWLPKDHPLAGKEKLTMDIFESENYIDIYSGKDIDGSRIFQKYGVNPRAYISAEDSFAVYSMVESGLGISFNHRGNCAKWNGNVVVRSLDPQIIIPIGLATTTVHAPLVDTFWNYLCHA